MCIKWSTIIWQIFVYILATASEYVNSTYVSYKDRVDSANIRATCAGGAHHTATHTAKTGPHP